MHHFLGDSRGAGSGIDLHTIRLVIMVVIIKVAMKSICYSILHCAQRAGDVVTNDHSLRILLSRSEAGDLSLHRPLAKLSTLTAMSIRDERSSSPQPPRPLDARQSPGVIVTCRRVFDLLDERRRSAKLGSINCSPVLSIAIMLYAIPAPGIEALLAHRCSV